MIKTGDKVLYNGKLYKVDYIRNYDRTAKIHSVRSKINEIIYYAKVEDLIKYENY